MGLALGLPARADDIPIPPFGWCATQKLGATGTATAWVEVHYCLPQQTPPNDWPRATLYSRPGELCAGVTFRSALTTVCTFALPAPSIPPVPAAPQVPLPPVVLPGGGLCGSQWVYVASGWPSVIASTCAPGGANDSPTSYLFTDPEGRRANCVGVKAHGGNVWVCFVSAPEWLPDIRWPI